MAKAARHLPISEVVIDVDYDELSSFYGRCSSCELSLCDGYGRLLTLLVRLDDELEFFVIRQLLAF